jgi:hypothetical protein
MTWGKWHSRNPNVQDLQIVFKSTKPSGGKECGIWQANPAIAPQIFAQMPRPYQSWDCSILFLNKNLRDHEWDDRCDRNHAQSAYKSRRSSIDYNKTNQASGSSSALNAGSPLALTIPSTFTVVPGKPKRGNRLTVELRIISRKRFKP